MSKNREAFESLGQHVQGGPLRPPFDPPTTARDVAMAIQAALVEVGLSPSAIRKIGCVLLSVSRHSDCRSDSSPPHANKEDSNADA